MNMGEDESLEISLKLVAEIREILKKYESQGLFAPKALAGIVRFAGIESCKYYNNFYTMLGILTESLTHDIHEIWLETQDEKET